MTGSAAFSSNRTLSLSEKDLPLVSIIIPCCNQARFLPEAVESALAQIYENIEIIIVDDGSVDPESQAIFATFQAPATRVIRQANRGAAGARNTGIREARGLYILPLDADDRIEPGYLAAAVPVLQAHPDIGIVTCNVRFSGASDELWRLPECSMENMLRGNCIHVSSLFRKSDWEAVGGYDDSLRQPYEDHDFWLSLLGLGKKAYRLDAVMLRYRRHPKSASATLSLEAKHDALARIFAKHIDLYRRHAHLSAQCIYWVLKPARPRYMEIKKGKYLVERTLLHCLAYLPGMARFCAKRRCRVEKALTHITRIEEQEKR